MASTWLERQANEAEVSHNLSDDRTIGLHNSLDKFLIFFIESLSILKYGSFSRVDIFLVERIDELIIRELKKLVGSLLGSISRSQRSSDSGFAPPVNGFEVPSLGVPDRL